MLIDDLAELEDYANLEGSELGEYCLAIVAVYSRPECISARFRTELDNEAHRLLQEFRLNTTIENFPMTRAYTQRVLTWKESKE